MDAEQYERCIAKLEQDIINLEAVVTRTTDMLLAAQSERDKLAAFKAFVHKVLDDAGVETHPNGPHSAEGCRIGDRLDEVLVWGRYVPQVPNSK